VKLLDTDPIIYEHLGDAYFKRGDIEQARGAWQKALELDQDLQTVKAKLNRLTPREATVTIVR
jgi:predicted negative regulator of RcsB-dependent stress response